MSEKIAYSDVLQTLQQHGRDKQQDRNNLVEEILMLAQCLQLDPTPDVYGRGALGGLLYTVRRLYEQFDCKMAPDELAERYAMHELESYAKDDDEVDKTRHWAREAGIVVRAIEVDCPDGTRRTMFASHLNQTSVTGTVYQEGEFIHNPNRFPPPFEFLLIGTPYQRTR